MYMRTAMLACLKLLRQLVLRAISLACAKTGNKIAARIAIIAITTSNSMRVNALSLYDLIRIDLLKLELIKKKWGSDHGAKESETGCRAKRTLLPEHKATSATSFRRCDLGAGQ